jgi:6-phosphogluconolactonase (cycloisomerase 2 family)
MYNDSFNKTKTFLKYYGYVTTTDNSIYSYEVLDDGSFKQIGQPVTGLNAPKRLVVHPSGDYIYAGSTGSILCFKTEQNGTLTQLEPFVNPTVSFHTLVVHPSGKYLYAISHEDANVYVFNINRDGTLAAGINIEREGISNGIAINSTGTMVFVSTSYADYPYIYSYQISDTGSLTNSKTYDDYSNNNSTYFNNLAIHPTGKYLYIIYKETSPLKSSIFILDIQNDGSLTNLLVPNSEADGILADLQEVNAPDIFINPVSKNLYVTIKTKPGVVFGVLNDGNIFKISENVQIPGTIPTFIEVHPDGKNVYIVDSGAQKSLIRYTAESGGTLFFNNFTAELTSGNPVDVKICTKTVFGEAK